MKPANKMAAKPKASPLKASPPKAPPKGVASKGVASKGVASKGPPVKGKAAASRMVQKYEQSGLLHQIFFGHGCVFLTACIMAVVAIASGYFVSKVDFYDSIISKLFPAAPGLGYSTTWCAVIFSLTFFVSQAVAASRLFRAASPAIDVWYSTMIVFDISAMALVTAPLTLIGVSPVPTGKGFTLFEDPSVFPTLANYAFLLLLAIFPVHSVCNICRVVYDACGSRASKMAILPAFAAQAWLLVPTLAKAWTLQQVFFCLTTVDYAQHLVGQLFWVVSACRAPAKSHARARFWDGFWGSFLHCISIIPLIAYLNFLSVDSHSTLVLNGLTVFMCSAMSISQTFWMKMALLTPASGPLMV